MPTPQAMPSSSPSTTYYSWFPGEDFLAVTLPNYETERRQIIYSIVVAVILFIFVLPFFLATRKVSSSNDSDDSVSESNDGERQPAISSSVPRPQQPSSQPTPSNTKQRRSNNKKQRNGKKDKEQQQQLPLPNNENNEETTTGIEFIATTSYILTLLCTLLLFCIVFFSNNNLFPARTILIAPLFTKEECARIITMAHDAAARNTKEVQKEKEMLLLKQNPEFMDLEVLEKQDGNRIDDATTVTGGGGDTGAAGASASHNTLNPLSIKLTKLESMLEEPSGWKKDRHNHYPTTDLNLVTDPFTHEDRVWLARKLNARLTPMVERTFGIFRGAIRANDIFVVRYDATKGQPNLRKHTDSSHLSFNVLLNDGFEGGGTRFHSRRDKSYVDHHPNVGEALLSHAQILHEGLATTNGTRYILVGFDSIDKKDPLTGEKTNLSIFSSWLNFPWMQVRFKEGFEDSAKERRSRIINTAGGGGGDGGDYLTGTWKYSRYAMSLFRDLDKAMTMLIDQFAPFRSLKIIDTKDYDAYFEVMDQAMMDQQQQQHNQVAGLSSNDEQQQQPLSRGDGYASWFKGQNIDLDVFGNYRRVWTSRKDQEDKFRGEL
mmetsp:Transcript_5757/g.12476  ORF Transcript_5757/g.12476 Transcript_5757/m.12476 type:complete len:602 (-) Transcript_5757:114-1919(-)